MKRVFSKGKSPWFILFLVFFFSYVIGYLVLRYKGVFFLYPYTSMNPVWRKYEVQRPYQIYSKYDLRRNKSSILYDYSVEENGKLSLLFVPLILIEESYWYDQWEKDIETGQN